MNEIATRVKIQPIIDEYNRKVENVDNAISDFESAISAIEISASIQGTYSGVRIHCSHKPYKSDMLKSLRMSAWKCVYERLNIAHIVPASFKDKFERTLENAPEFTMGNVRATFGPYLLDPRFYMLKGLAEAFCKLDNKYKSHSNVKVGVKGLPKRIIFTNVIGFMAHGSQDRVVNALNALFAVQCKPMIKNWGKLEPYIRDINTAKINDEKSPYYTPIDMSGLTFKTFENGNLHIHFDAQNCLDINRALAEFYGDVLPDVYEHGDGQASTDVSKDLQFYPTPEDVAKTLCRDMYAGLGNKVLEPSCGEGHIMDFIRDDFDVVGYEIDKTRAETCKSKGHNVVVRNFLDVTPSPEFAYVIMNPPFYGRHYLNHINHAIKFLAPRGKLVSVLPATAWYDHKQLPHGLWHDLPVASFSESGTNIPTGIYTYTRS